MKIYIDIDHTICTVTDGFYSYQAALPVQAAIDKANALFDAGHYIVYWTARGTSTGIDWREVTEQQFEDWGVKYHELLFGKPTYDVLIDDKTINTSDWLLLP